MTIERLAANACMSKINFSVRFKQQVGISPIDYLIRLRMQNACVLLRETNQKIREIADKVGYADEFYFSRIFAKVIGCPPSKWREECC